MLQILKNAIYLLFAFHLIPFSLAQQRNPWNQKILIVYDPETRTSLYVPASVFFEKFGGGSSTSARLSSEVEAATPRNPFICDIFTRTCWSPRLGAVSTSSEERNNDLENAETQFPSNPSTTLPPRTGGGGTIFGHPNFHQGEFPVATTNRPFQAWNSGNRITTTQRPFEQGSSASASGVAHRGGGGGAHIFGHPDFHQGIFPEATTARPFRPWVPPPSNELDESNSRQFSSSSSSTSSRNGNHIVSQTTNMVNGRRVKRAAGRSNSASSSSSSFGKNYGSNYPEDLPYQIQDLARLQQQYFNNAFGQGAIAGGFAASAGFPTGYPGQNYGNNGGYAQSFGDVSSRFNTNAGTSSSSYGPVANSGGFSASSGVSSSTNSGAGYSASSGAGYSASSGAGYSGNNGVGYSNHFSGSNFKDDDMKYSTQTTKDGMIETRMEGKKCDANGCRSSSSSSAVYNPGHGSSYSTSNGASGGRYSTEKHETYDRAGTKSSYYEPTTSTTRKPYTYSTTRPSYTYSTTRPSYTYSTTTKPYSYYTTTEGKARS